jgi:DGQHR domain-containing protein
MKTERLINNNKQYLKIELEEFNQKDHSFYLAKINANDFLKIYTIRPAEYDLEKHNSLAVSFPDEADYYQHLLKEDKEKIAEKDFQREADTDRISSIAKFLNTEEYAFFPNTIITNCELINDREESQIDEDSSEEDFFNFKEKPDFISFLKKQGEKYFLYVPYMAKSVLVIDGQHRLEGLKKAEQSILDHYDLLIAFIIGFDRSVIAKQFYTINYEQKPVNKSLLYQLTGEFTREINELSFMHNVVKLLNELNESPFYSRLKMLGRAPKNYSSEAKKKLSISQAFLIDSLIRFVSAKAKGTLYPPVFLKFYKNPDEHIVIVRAIARYFNAVKIIKPEWDNPDQSIISKGIGVTALLRVYSFLIQVIVKDELGNNIDRISELKIEDYQRVLKGLENVDFTTGGPYGKTGSGGSISKIKDDILRNLVFLSNTSDVKVFESDFKENYLSNFSNLI